MQDFSLWWENFKQKIHFSIPPKLGVLFVVLIPLATASVAAGGTYLIASNAAESNTQTASFQDKLLSIPTPIPTVPVPTESIPLTATPTPDPTASWPSYDFNTLYLNFRYPTGWNVVVGNTSGPPYLHIRNFIASGSAALQDTNGEYAIRVSRFPQVGITTIDQLTAQLAINDGSGVNEDGQNLGTVSATTTSIGKINGYLSFGRAITYSTNPSQQIPEVFVFDGLGNVVRVVPQLDVSGTQPYFNQVISTFTFTNSNN